VVSWLRFYSHKELWALVDMVHDKEKYEWKIADKKSGATKITYLVAWKK